jgi:hypothetical protein
MGGVRAGILGAETGARPAAGDNLSADLFGGGDPPGVLGADGTIQLDSASRIIANVTKDWDPTSPPGSPLIVSGATIERVGRALNALGEWGQGGGRLEVDRVPFGTSTDVTVNLKAHLVRRMPQWKEYPQVSAAAQTEWNKMYRKLVDHEDRHVEIAVEEAEKLAADLIGQDISKIARMVTAANARMAKRQQEMDTASDHGARPGVPYGDVSLDITIV